jgi:hypothetical protein
VPERFAEVYRSMLGDVDNSSGSQFRIHQILPSCKIPKDQSLDPLIQVLVRLNSNSASTLM